MLRSQLSLAVLVLALLTIGVGAYMALLRPPLLPEDVRAIGVEAGSLPPSLLRWLSLVFATWGGFVTGFGVLLLGIAKMVSTGETRALFWTAALGIIIAFGRFLWSNVVLRSDFLGFIALLFALAVAVAIMLVLSNIRRTSGPAG